MFAPAERKNENPAEIDVVHKGMNESSLKKKASETIFSTKLKKRRKKTLLNTTHSIHNIGKQPTQNNTKKMATFKRPYPTDETVSPLEVDENPRKHRKHKDTSNIFMEDDLDETIIINKKKEMYSSLKSKELEETLFSKNAALKDEPNETTMTNKEKGICSPVKSKKLKQKLLNKHIVPDGNEDKTIITNKNKEKTSPLKSNKLKQKLLSKNIVPKGNMGKTIIANKNKEENNSVKSKKLEQRLLSKKTVPKVNVEKTIIANKNKKLNNSEKAKELDQSQLRKNIVPKVQSGGVHDRKKNKIKNVLQMSLVKRSPINTNGANLYERMMERLKAAHFRSVNEELYLSEGKDAKEMFKNDPTAFKVYHDGYRQQVKKWPINPLEIIIKNISKMPKETKVADLGCGEGALAKRVPQKVRSFDLVSVSDEVEECDMAHTPLLTGEMDVAVFCLALMGTNLNEYFIEANRILKVGGIMKIAEVESRFQNMNDFIKGVERYGFKMTRMDDSHQVFYFIDFKKISDLGSKKKLPHITLNPCLYKKR